MKLLHADATLKTRDFFEKYIFLLWLVHFSFTTLQPLTLLPGKIFYWVGPLRLLPQAAADFILSAPFLVFLKAAIIVSLLLFLFDRAKDAAATAACFFITFEEGMIRSIGYINHSEIVILTCLYVITLMRLADWFWLKNKKNSGGINLYPMPIVFSMMILCFSYMFLGVYRLVHGGIRIYTEGWLSWWILLNTLQPSSSHFSLGMLVVKYDGLRNLLHFGFPLATLFEILAPLALVSRPARYLFVAFMLPFHLLIYLFMNIFFWQNMALYVFFFDLTHFFKPQSPIKK